MRILKCKQRNIAHTDCGGTADHRQILAVGVIVVVVKLAVWGGCELSKVEIKQIGVGGAACIEVVVHHLGRLGGRVAVGRAGSGADMVHRMACALAEHSECVMDKIDPASDSARAAAHVIAHAYVHGAAGAVDEELVVHHPAGTVTDRHADKHADGLAARRLKADAVTSHSVELGGAAPVDGSVVGRSVFAAADFVMGDKVHVAAARIGDSVTVGVGHQVAVKHQTGTVAVGSRVEVGVATVHVVPDKVDPVVGGPARNRNRIGAACGGGVGADDAVLEIKILVHACKFHTDLRYHRIAYGQVFKDDIRNRVQGDRLGIGGTDNHIGGLAALRGEGDHVGLTRTWEKVGLFNCRIVAGSNRHGHRACNAAVAQCMKGVVQRIEMRTRPANKVFALQRCVGAAVHVGTQGVVLRNLVGHAVGHGGDNLKPVDTRHPYEAAKRNLLLGLRGDAALPLHGRLGHAVDAPVQRQAAYDGIAAVLNLHRDIFAASGHTGGGGRTGKREQGGVVGQQHTVVCAHAGRLLTRNSLDIRLHQGRAGELRTGDDLQIVVQIYIFGNTPYGIGIHCLDVGEIGERLGNVSHLFSCGGAVEHVVVKLVALVIYIQVERVDICGAATMHDDQVVFDIHHPCGIFVVGIQSVGITAGCWAVHGGIHGVVVYVGLQ